MSGLNRREFILASAGCAAFAQGCALGRRDDVELVRFGMVSDLHYARIPRPEDSDRYYDQGIVKLHECVETMNERQVDFLIELGDFKDECPTKEETLACLDEIEAEFRRFRGPRYHVLGNHENDCLTKEEVLAHVSNFGQERAKSYYSFERGGVTFVVLDANFNSRMEPYAPGNWDWADANVPPEELAWMERTLAAARGPVIVFAHQRIDPAAERLHLVKNAAAVREILERSGKVAAVLTGHQHWGGLVTLNGIFYYTLRALVVGAAPECNSYAEVSFYGSGKIIVRGFRQAETAVCAAQDAFR